MGVRLGTVRFEATQRMVALEKRRNVLAGAPGQKGAVAQDLGHQPARIELEALLFGMGATVDLESLRSAWQKAKPLAFSSDIVTGTEITEVVIEDLKVDQQAGTTDTWRCVMKLREHTEPPSKMDLGFLGVLKGILADAGKWMKLAQSVMRVINDPSCFMDELLKNPDLLDMLGMKDLADGILNNLEQLLPEELKGIVEAIGKIDPSKVVDLINAIKDADSLEDFLKKGGLETVTAIVGAVGGPEAAKLVGDVGDAAAAVVNLASNPELLSDLKAVIDAGRRIGATLSRPQDLLPGGLL